MADNSTGDALAPPAGRHRITGETPVPHVTTGETPVTHITGETVSAVTL